MQPDLSIAKPDPIGQAAGSCDLDDRSFERLSVLARELAGLMVPEAKRSLVRSRLTKHLRRLGLGSFAAYCDLLEETENRDEHKTFVSALTTNVTAFFRERHHFDDLAQNVVPFLQAQAAAGERVRLWSAGCSIGAEAYSVACQLLLSWPGVERADVKILATDVDSNVITQARAGIYDAELVEKEVAERFRQQFIRDGDRFSVSDALRNLVSVKMLNLAQPWPVSGPFHAVFCRNVVIYFDDDLTEQIWSKFAQLIPVGGRLYVGHSERVSGPALEFFEPAGVTTYRRVAGRGLS